MQAPRGHSAPVGQGMAALPPNDSLHGRMASLNQLQASKVRVLMGSISELERSNSQLKHQSLEHRRTAEFQRLQAELGKQDGMILALRRRIGETTADELIKSAIGKLEKAHTCSDVGEIIAASTRGCSECGTVHRQLHKSDDGSLFCQPCYTRRYWAEPAPSSNVATHLQLKTHADLMDDLKRGQRELANAKAALRQAKEEDAMRKAGTANNTKAEFPFESTCEALLSLLRQHEFSKHRLMQEGVSLDEQHAALERSAAEQRLLESSILEENMASPSFQTDWDVEHGELESQLHLADVETVQLRGVVDQLKLQLERQRQQQQELSDRYAQAVGEMNAVEIKESETKKAMIDEHSRKLQSDRSQNVLIDEQLEHRQALLNKTRQQCNLSLQQRQERAIALREEAATREQEFCGALAARVEAARQKAKLRFAEGVTARLEALEFAEEECGAADMEGDDALFSLEAAREDARMLANQLNDLAAVLAKEQQESADVGSGWQAETEAALKEQHVIAAQEFALHSEVEGAEQTLAAMKDALVSLGLQEPAKTSSVRAGVGTEAASVITSQAEALQCQSVEDLQALLQQITMQAANDRQAACAELHRVQQEISSSEGAWAAVLNGGDTVTEEAIVASTTVPVSQGSMPPEHSLVPLPPSLLLAPKACPQTMTQNSAHLFHSSALPQQVPVAAAPPKVAASCKVPQVSFRVGGNDSSYAAETAALKEQAKQLRLRLAEARSAVTQDVTWSQQMELEEVAGLEERRCELEEQVQHLRGQLAGVKPRSP